MHTYNVTITTRRGYQISWCVIDSRDLLGYTRYLNAFYNPEASTITVEQVS